MAYGEGLSDSRGGWIRYAQRLRPKEAIDPKELEKLERRLYRGWCVGEREFREAVAKDLMLQDGAIVLEKEALAEMNHLQWEMLLKESLKVLGKARSDLLSEQVAPKVEDNEQAQRWLKSSKPKSRAKGLKRLAKVKAPDLFDWCVMFLEDESRNVRVAAPHAMVYCDESFFSVLSGRN
jgi:hypothetical protein